MTDVATDPPRKGKAAAITRAPVDLVTIKDDLQPPIPADDTTHDAWLQRRIDGIWSRIETYCMRRLPCPPATFVDNWGKVISNNLHRAEPPLLRFPPRASVFLRCFPVVSIVSITCNDQPFDAAKVMFDADSGKLFTVDEAQLAHDLGQELLNGRALITYTAGWEELPLDLYEALIGALQPLWAQRSSSSAGGPGGTISGINVMDVGSIEMSSGSPFVSASTKGAGAVDPLLGPFAMLLEPYVDWRATIGSPLFPTTDEVPAPP